MEPTSRASQDVTQPNRKHSASNDPAKQRPARRPGSDVRVWPPKPETPAATTVADFDLDSVREGDPGFHPVVIIDAILVEHLCPTCEVKLIDPDGMGICPKCGLCRSLKEGCEQLAAVEEAARREAPPESTRPRLPRFPSWIWGLLGGCMLILGTAIIAGQSFPNHCRERTVWSTYQLIAGLGAVLVAQWWVILKLEPDLGKLGVMEMFVISGRLWSHALQRMPYTLGPIYLGSWGLFIAITAVTITGGLADWFAPRG